MYVDDLALIYPAKATAIIKCKMQGATDPLVENADSIEFSFSVT